MCCIDRLKPQPKADIQILPDIDLGNALAGIHTKKRLGVRALFQEAPFTSCAVPPELRSAPFYVPAESGVDLLHVFESKLDSFALPNSIRSLSFIPPTRRASGPCT